MPCLPDAPLLLCLSQPSARYADRTTLPLPHIEGNHPPTLITRTSIPPAVAAQIVSLMASQSSSVHHLRQSPPLLSSKHCCLQRRMEADIKRSKTSHGWMSWCIKSAYATMHLTIMLIPFDKIEYYVIKLPPANCYCSRMWCCPSDSKTWSPRHHHRHHQLTRS